MKQRNKTKTKISPSAQAIINQIVLRNLKRLDITPDQKAMIAELLAAK